MLTDIAIKTAKPQDRPLKIFDGGGLFVMINPNGSKLWRLKYRHQGKERLASFGAYPIVSLKDARLKRDEFKKRLASGEDPLSSNKGATFETAARDFVARQAQRLKPRYRRDTLRRLELNVFPDLGHLPIATIEAPDLLRVLRKIEARGSFEMAARVRATCSQIFRFGIAAGYNKRDVAADLVGALTPHKVRHHAALKVEELPELLRKINESTEEEPVTRLALLFLANTAVRTSELIGAEWTEFDIRAAVWTVPSARMKMGKEHLVPLSRQVLRLLEELCEISGVFRRGIKTPLAG